MGDPRRVPNFSKPRSGLAQWSSVVQHTRIREVRCTGPVLSGPVPSNGSCYTRARCSVQEEYPPLNPLIRVVTEIVETAARRCDGGFGLFVRNLRVLRELVDCHYHPFSLSVRLH